MEASLTEVVTRDGLESIYVVSNADAMQASSIHLLFPFSSSFFSFIRPLAVPDDAIGRLLPVSVDIVTYHCQHTQLWQHRSC